MKKLILLIVALLYLGDLAPAHAQSRTHDPRAVTFEDVERILDDTDEKYGDPVYRRDPISPGPYHRTLKRPTPEAKEGVRRAVSAVAGTRAEILEAHHYVEWKGGGTVCGTARINGRVQAFIFQRPGATDPSQREYATINAQPREGRVAGCDRPGGSEIAPE